MNKFKKPNCIIAARGGSKRLKNKNIIKVNGKSMIEIVITKAIKSKIFDKVIVSTDSMRVAKIAKKSGADVPYLRSKKLSGDKVGLLPVIKDVVLKTESKQKKVNFFIYPTAILLRINDLKRAYNKFLKKNYNFLIAVQKNEINPLKSFIIKNKKFLKYKWPLNKNKRGQDFEQFYYDAGSFFIFDTNFFLKYGFNEKKNTFYLLDQFSSVDINNKDNLNLAILFYNLKNNKNLKN